MSTNGKFPTNILSPLRGRRVLVTRAADQAGDFSVLLRQRGAEAVECSVIELVPPLQWDDVDAAIHSLSSFDWLILTSVNGVRFFFERLRELGSDPGAVQGCKVCAVGPKTAEALGRRGITPDLVPDQFTGEGVVAAFQGIDLQGRRLLFPKADGARDLIPQQLRARGAQVVDPVVYRNVMPQALPDDAHQALKQHQVDAVVFSSPSTVRNFAALAGGAEQLLGMLDNVVVASIGPVTSKACREWGLHVTVEPEHATLDDLVVELERYFGTL
jgi:uroporphyrinogen-III synthase